MNNVKQEIGDGETHQIVLDSELPEEAKADIEVTTSAEFQHLEKREHDEAQKQRNI